MLAGYDPNDPATAACLTPGNCFSDYTQFLDRKALKGARIAVFSPTSPLPSNRQALLDAAVSALRAEGASVRVLAVTDVPAQLGICVSVPAPANCSTVLLYGQKRDMDAYLSTRTGSPMGSLADIVAFNATHVPPMKYGQAIFEAAAMLDTSPGSADTLRYEADRAEDLRRSRDALNALYNGPDGIRGTADDIDAILAVGNNFAGTPAKAGFPSVTVPGGLIMPLAGVDPPIARPFPQTITFSGPAFSEPRLIALAYAFEQATKHRMAPFSTPPLPTDTVVRP